MMAEAATSCDLALLEEPDHDEATALRADLPKDGVPIEALTMDLPAMEDPPEDLELDEPMLGYMRVSRSSRLAYEEKRLSRFVCGTP